MINKQFNLAKRPNGMPEDDCWELQENEIPDLLENQILIEVNYLSVDPYMRGRMNDMKSYAEPVKIGGIMVGESVGKVIQSRSEKYNIGDFVTAHLGWQTHIVADDNSLFVRRIYPDLAPIQAFLGVAGMPGRAVGSVVGQLAKLKGCKTIGIAGGKEKCSFVKDEMGLDHAIDYKSGDLEKSLNDACPNGIDIYFENVGGEVSNAVAPLINHGARVPICGYISAYNSFNPDMDSRDDLPETPFDVFGSLDPVPEHRFFVVTEFMDKWDMATKELTEWIRKGEIKYKESVLEGFENMPQGLRNVLSGKNFGKQLIKV